MSKATKRSGDAVSDERIEALEDLRNGDDEELARFADRLLGALDYSKEDTNA